jgi:hypothetical protein
MTNKDRQNSLDKKKWLASEECGTDMSGAMPYCKFCEKRFGMNCKADQSDRTKDSLCAIAYNRLVRNQQKNRLQHGDK